MSGHRHGRAGRRRPAPSGRRLRRRLVLVRRGRYQGRGAARRRSDTRAGCKRRPARPDGLGQVDAAAAPARLDRARRGPRAARRPGGRAGRLRRARAAHRPRLSDARDAALRGDLPRRRGLRAASARLARRRRRRGRRGPRSRRSACRPSASASRHPYSLSGGEQRRLALAGVLAMRPGLLLLDEPFVSLDPASRRDLEAILRGLRAGGMGLLLATHDVDRAYALCDGRVVLDEGVVVDAGPVAVRRRRRGRAPRRTGSSRRSWSSCGGASAAQRPRRRHSSPPPPRRSGRRRDEDGGRPVLRAAVADPPARRALQGRRRDGARHRAVPALVVCRARGLRTRPPPPGCC